MDRRLFLVLGLSLIVALVISSVFYFQVVGHTGGSKKDANVKEIVVATRQLEVGVTIKPGDVHLAKTSAEMFPKGAFAKIEEVIDRPVVNRILVDEPVQEGRLAFVVADLDLLRSFQSVCELSRFASRMSPVLPDSFFRACVSTCS